MFQQLQIHCLNSKKYLSLYRIPVKLRCTCQGSVLQANYAPRCQYPQCHIIRPDPDIGASDGRSLLFGAQGTGGGDSREDEEQGAWPSMEYTSYRDFSNPVLRSLDLIQGLKVKNK